MKRFFFALLLGALYSFTYAQGGKTSGPGVIRCRIIDSLSHKPVEFAVAVVYRDGKPVWQVITGGKGEIKATGLSAGTYKIVVSLIGYRTFTKDKISITATEPEVSLGDIPFAESVHQLKDVTVTAVQEIVDNKLDKMVYHADKDITSSGGVAIDVLKKVPQVSVDANGNVELQGSGGVRILVNGKTSALLRSNPTDVLQSIPADQIKNIEVITNPSSKYDAQGVGGIINIVMKKSLVEGMTGSVNLSAGTKIEKSSAALSYRRDNFGVNLNLGGNVFLPQDGITNNFRSTTLDGATSILTQKGTNRTGRRNFFPSLELDWDISKKNNITTELAYSHFSNDNRGALSIASNTEGQNNEQVTSRHSDNQVSEESFDFSTVYKHAYDSTDKALELTLEASTGRIKLDYSLDQYLQSSTQPLDPHAFLLSETGNNLGKENQAIFGADFTQPLGEESALEVGAKATYYTISSNYIYNVLDTVSNTYKNDLTRSNTFDYRQHVEAAYATYSAKLGEHYEMKIGARYEITFNNSSLVNTGALHSQFYDNFIPSFVLSRKFGSRSLKLSYTRRLERPEYDEMNPFFNISDRSNISSGNPFLVPEKQHRVELAYSSARKSGASFTTAVFYKYQSDDIQNYATLYSRYVIGKDTLKDVTVSMPQNIVVKNSVGVSMYGSAPLTSKLNVRVNLNAFEDFLKNVADPSGSVDVFRYYFNTNITYELYDNLVAEAFGVFNSRRFTLQGYRPSYTEYSFAIKKQFHDKKGSIGLIATNPFSQYRDFASSVTGPNFVQRNLFSVPFRSFGITFSYQFGKMNYKPQREATNESLLQY